jgi:hypothetical protein
MITLLIVSLVLTLAIVISGSAQQGFMNQSTVQPTALILPTVPMERS